VFLVSGLGSPRTWLALAHHLTGVFIGIAICVLVVVGLFFGVGLVPIMLIGFVFIGFTMRCAELFARFERRRFAFFLGAPIPVWPASARVGYRWGLVPRWKKFSERATWCEIGYALARLPISLLTAAVSLFVWSLGLVLLTLPLYGPALPSGGIVLGSTVLRGAPTLASGAAIGLVLLLAAPWVTRGLAAADAAIARSLLAPPTDLTARVAELERSRERVVDAAETERRRIERDLHDGAQQRLVALAMELGRAKAKLADDVDAAKVLVDQAHAEAKAALTEIRDLVRGVHPPVLTDRGLDAALSGLAARCPVPVDVSVDVPVRPRPAVEAVAYFVVAEALTNVAKHSRASHAAVVVEGHGYPGTLNIVISDDGIGGADPRGAGLTGLADRIAGVDGRLTVESPPGGPTIVSAVLPCG
jgi:signal transduction histidine kinase